jgi:hypothetical protein
METGDYYGVVYHLGSKRARLNFIDLEKARAEAQAKAAQLARNDVDEAQLSGKDRLAFGRACEALRETGVTLDSAAAEFAAAYRVLGGHSLLEAAKLYMRHHGRGVTAKLVAEAVAEFIETERAESRSELYLTDLRRLPRLAGVCQ